MAKSIFLIGYRGTGKSSVARALAELVGLDAIDSDDLIEHRAGKSIARIFAENGEEFFRDLEEQTVAELCAAKPAVVALGGGAVLRPATRKRLAGAGDVVWLTAQPETLAARISADRDTTQRRPGLTSRGVLAEIKQVLADRTPIYRECATLVVDTEGRSPQQVAEAIYSSISNTQKR